VAAGVALLAGLGAVAAVSASAGDDQPDEARVDATVTTVAAQTTTSSSTTTTTQIERATAHQAFDRAADRLVSAGSFAYAGTTHATDVSHVRPGMWLAVEVTVEGEVVTSAHRVHEISVDGAGRAAETVTDGPTVWSRAATSPATLGEVDYLGITEHSGRESTSKGLALLPAWLASSVDRRDAGTDDLGRRLLRASLPAAVLGEIVDGRPAADADILLALDAAGDPVRVEITSVPNGPPLRLALDISRIAEGVVIDLPTDPSPG
jgi:hypothetical protein